MKLSSTSLLLILLTTITSYLLLQTFTPTTTSAEFTVNATHDAVDINPGDGICETDTGNNICTLRAAIQETNALNGADTIHLPSGVFTLTLPGDDNGGAMGDLDITDDLTLIGASAATTIIDANQLDRAIRIGCDTPSYPSPGDGCPPTHPIVTITDLTITNGYAPRGGGIYNFHGQLTVSDVIIHHNTVMSPYHGGGIFNQAGDLIVNNSIIHDNTAADGGGGLFSFNGSLIISNTHFHNNSTPIFGGAIMSVSDATLTNVTIENNTADFLGGGLFMQHQASVINNSLITNNTSIYGSGVFTNQDLNLTNSTITHNTAESNGGGIYIYRHANIENSTIAHNNARFGGGVFVEGSTNITNTTITHNDAQTAGGGLYNWVENSILEHEININYATFAYNSSPLAASLYRIDTASLDTISNSIITHDIGPSCYGNYTSGGYNIVADASCNFSNSGDLQNTPIHLETLADNGGHTPSYRLHHLSPAINHIPAGTNGCGTTFTTDQLNQTRPQGPACDAGAYELPPSTHINNVTLVEPDEGSTTADFIIHLGTTTATTSTIDYTTTADTASPGEDYESTQGTLLFSPGVISHTISIPIYSNVGQPEPAETFYLTLSNPTNMTIYQAQGTVTILSNDYKTFLPVIVNP
ncbi:MAG TPA: choice-of-anchor Q domain-containing protein [Anaerolineae bacterium]|nr:choice-of-anchor Q domain-containing protein [Anaerolineae bacterium]